MPFLKGRFPISVTARPPWDLTRDEAGDAGHLGDEGRGRSVVHDVRGVQLLQASISHHAHPVSRGEGLLPVVGDEHRGRAALAQDALHLSPHLLPHGGVQVAEGLVEQDDHRPGRDGPGQRDPLLLSAGQLMGVASFQTAEPGYRHHLGGPAVSLARGQPVQSEGDVSSHALVGEEGVLLEDHADVPPVGGHVQATAGDRLALQAHLSIVGDLEARDQPQHGGLAAAAGPQDGDDLSRPQGEADPIHGLHVSVPLGQPPALDDGAPHAAHPPSLRGVGRLSRTIK